MKYLLTITLISILSCNSKSDIETLVKQYMKDSVVPKFNDPASYQFVSMKIDTFKGQDYLKNLQELYINDTLADKNVIEEKKKEITKLSSSPGYSDSILNLQIEVKYRGKNKMGALILDDLDLRYFPQENKIVEVQ